MNQRVLRPDSEVALSLECHARSMFIYKFVRNCTVFTTANKMFHIILSFFYALPFLQPTLRIPL